MLDRFAQRVDRGAELSADRGTHHRIHQAPTFSLRCGSSTLFDIARVNCPRCIQSHYDRASSRTLSDALRGRDDVPQRRPFSERALRDAD